MNGGIGKNRIILRLKSIGLSNISAKEFSIAMLFFGSLSFDKIGFV